MFSYILLSNSLPPDYDLWQNKCYLYRNKTALNHKEAHSKCNTTGGRLITILSRAEMTYIFKTYKPVSYWLSCTDNNPLKGYWTCEGYEEETLHFTVGGTKAGFWSK